MSILVGDVFAIPIDDARQALGQVVARYRQTELYCLAIFDQIIRGGDNLPALETLGNWDVVFVASTFDALLVGGVWRPVCNTPPRELPLPCYKVLQEGTYFVESWDGSRRRKATPEEVEILDNRGGVAPIRLQNAVKAYYGVVAWHASFEKLTYEWTRRRALVKW